LERLLFRIEGGAVGEVGTIEGVETTELLFKTYAVVGPAEVVGTIEDVETIELLFRTETWLKKIQSSGQTDMLTAKEQKTTPPQ
jgi:hypothetical protein